MDCTYLTKIGYITISENNGKVVGISFGNNSENLQTDSMILNNAYEEICQYLNGERKFFSFPYELTGTEFQKKVYNALLNIPYGEVRTYKEIAEEIGNPKACRAVGNANNRNPLPIIVPCHRVIGSDRSLTGYAGGLDMKKFLLNIEKEMCDMNDDE